MKFQIKIISKNSLERKKYLLYNVIEKFARRKSISESLLTYLHSVVIFSTNRFNFINFSDSFTIRSTQILHTLFCVFSLFCSARNYLSYQTTNFDYIHYILW